MSDWKEVKDPQAWNNWLLQQNPNTFLQSWEWGQSQPPDKHHVRYLAFFKDGTQTAAALLITIRAKRGTFILCPHGPITNNLPDTLPRLVTYAKSIAKSDRAVALRVAPLTLDTPHTRQLFRRLGFRPAPIHVHAELTWVLDISNKDNDKLLQNMRKTTRHAIKKALKHPNNLTAQIITDPQEAINRFWPLYKTTGSRHNFVPYSKELLTRQLKMFTSNGGFAYLTIAQHNHRDVAGAIVFIFGHTAFYYHGASEKLPSSLPASHLVQWHAIQEARRRGCVRYNFWGIAPDNQPQHPFAGITIFKKGFGGYSLNYLHAQDLPLSLGYWRLWATETWRKFKRGF